MIAALWIIKDPSADDDRGTHAEERNKASQHSDHCSLPWFFCFSMHDSTHYIRIGLHRRRAVSRSRFRALTRIKLSVHGPGGTATVEASKPRFGVPALANARYAGVGTREVAAPFDIGAFVRSAERLHIAKRRQFALQLREIAGRQSRRRFL